MKLPLAAGGLKVFRLVPMTATFVPPGNKPPPDSFRPTDDDVSEAKERSFDWPLASVWDTSKTLVREAATFRSKPARAFAVEVDAVRAMKVDQLPHPEVYVDPVAPKEGFGAGHCGISVLRALNDDSDARKLKNAFKALRALVAGSAVEWFDPPGSSG